MIMKKLWILALALVLSFTLLVACTGGEDEEETTDKGTEAEVTTPEEGTTEEATTEEATTEEATTEEVTTVDPSVWNDDYSANY